MRTTLEIACILAVPAGFTEAQVNGNDMPLNNGSEVIYLYSDPSVGSSSTGVGK